MPPLDDKRLRRLIEVGRSITAELDLDVVLERLLEVACELTGARYAALGVLDSRRERLERFITRGIDADARQVIGDLPRGHGVLGTLIRDPRPLRLPNVGGHPDSWGFPPGHPPMTTFLGLPIMIRGEAFGNLYLTEKENGAEFDAQDEEAMSVLADWAAVGIANAQAHLHVRERHDQLARAVTSLEATMEIARAIGAETRLDRVLELIVKRGRALVKARGMAVLVQEEDDMVVVAMAGELDRSILGLRIPLAESVSGHVLATRRSERLADVPSRLRSGLAGELNANSGLYVPLVYQGKAFGVLNAFDRMEDGPEFDAEDERLMSSFAASAAVAVATAQNTAAYGLRRSIEAAERERAHWARELHDETLQELAALSIRLSAARSMHDIEDVRVALDEAVAHVGEAAQALRELITELRPASLDQLGLEPALDTLTRRVAELHGLDVSLEVDLALENGRARSRLAPEIENALYRLVQEALSNVVKHSGAGGARIRVVETDGGVHASISDDGGGFAESDRTEGFGLVGMRERVSLVGGSIEIESGPGTGTTIRATVPAVHLDDGLERPARPAGAGPGAKLGRGQTKSA